MEVILKSTNTWYTPSWTWFLESQPESPFHDDVIEWKQFSRYRSFVKVLLQCRGLLRLIVLTDICDDHVIWWPRREWTEWIPKLVWIVMTHNDLCTCIALTKWDGPVACVNVTENVENFQSKCYHFTATKTSVTVSVKQYEHDRVTRCTFSVDFKEIKTISQSLPST